MTKEQMQSRIDTQQQAIDAYVSDNKRLKAVNEELRRKNEEMSVELLKLEAVKKSLIELLKPEICEIVEGYKNDVESMVSNAIDEDHAHEYEASLGYDA